MDISSIVREKAPVIEAEIKKARSVLLHCHPSPDPDSVGSALATKFALEGVGKTVTVIRGDSPIPQAFMHFPGATSIVPKSFAEVDLTSFDLFIILDSGSPSMISKVSVPQFPLPISTISIDHHASNTGYANLNLIDLTASSTAFILYQLFSVLGCTITREIALNLFMGIYTDSGGFRYPPTDYRVFESAGELVKIVPDFTKAIFLMENNERKESIYFRALALNSIETFCQDSIAIASVSFAQITEKKIPEECMHSEIPNLLKSVIGWNVGVICIEARPNLVKISMRSRDVEKYDVSKLATSLGGGGHRAAAGITLKMSLAEAKQILVAKAKELYNL